MGLSVTQAKGLSISKVSMFHPKSEILRDLKGQRSDYRILGVSCPYIGRLGQVYQLTVSRRLLYT